MLLSSALLRISSCLLENLIIYLESIRFGTYGYHPQMMLHFSHTSFLIATGDQKLLDTFMDGPLANIHLGWKITLETLL